ncbi:hypothetical protein VN97_g11763, partial [Penicillium thymicola]
LSVARGKESVTDNALFWLIGFLRFLRFPGLPSHARQ